jgi:uncharacterized OB-fold protein
MGLNAALNVPLTGERRRDDGRTLVGVRCSHCHAASFPARAVCHQCGAAAPQETPFAPTGTLITYTTVHVERPGMPVPYTLGQVAVDEQGPLVFGQVKATEDQLTTGTHVRVVIAAEGETPKYWFVPV